MLKSAPRGLALKTSKKDVGAEAPCGRTSNSNLKVRLTVLHKLPQILIRLD